MFYKVFALSFLLFLAPYLLPGQAVNNDYLDNITISILTCGPGKYAYDLFGHSAIRVQDLNSGVDLVYNYGTYDFDTPGFYPKFLRGQLDYALSISRFERFLRTYERDRRSVTMQVMDLNRKEKFDILKALEENSKEQNRYYKYDFYFDNCTTRIKELFEKQVGNINYESINDENYSFRNLLHLNLENHLWTQFGMDIILGTLSDRRASRDQQMFLPKFYFDYMETSSVPEKKLVSETNDIMTFPDQIKKGSWFSPFRAFIILLAIEIIGFFLFYISGDRGALLIYDRVWFFLIGLASLIFLLLWFATDHLVCKNNFNLLWAGPWSILYFLKWNNLQRTGLFLTLLCSVVYIVFFQFIPQGLHEVTILIACITVLKCLRLLGISKLLDKMRFVVVTLIFIISWAPLQSQAKIGGITLVAPPSIFQTDPLQELKNVNANWVAFVPFAYSRPGDPEVRHGFSRQWWGERTEGIRTSVQLAKKNNLNVMLKPQVWIPGDWVGNMDFESEKDWEKWESTYEHYIMQYVELAIAQDVEMICIGTEYRISAIKREKFWRNLIEKVRGKFDGKITYSANWDDFEKIPFWDLLDYIGISAYFPLSDMTTPTEMLLSYKWKKHLKKLKNFSKKWKKSILFTEFGYLSVDGAAGKTWELEKNVRSLNINQKAQAISYQALLKTFWNQQFWAGGFLWKWFPEGKGHEGYPERDYTPQNKEAEKVVAQWYLHNKQNE